MTTFTFFIVAWTKFWQFNLKDNQIRLVVFNSVVTCFCEWWHWKPAHLSRTEWSLSHPLLGICGSSSAPISAAPPWQTSPPDQQQYPRSEKKRQQLIWAFKQTLDDFFFIDLYEDKNEDIKIFYSRSYKWYTIQLFSTMHYLEYFKKWSYFEGLIWILN